MHKLLKNQNHLKKKSKNYDNLKDHVALQDERSGATHDTREFISINGYETAVEEVFSNPSKNYQIFAKQCIYIFSTNHPELYNDLDSIANSFQYTGK